MFFLSSLPLQKNYLPMEHQGTDEDDLEWTSQHHLNFHLEFQIQLYPKNDQQIEDHFLLHYSTSSIPTSLYCHFLLITNCVNDQQQYLYIYFQMYQTKNCPVFVQHLEKKSWEYSRLMYMSIFLPYTDR